MMKWLKEYLAKNGITKRSVVWVTAAYLSFIVLPIGALMTALLFRAEEKKHPEGDYAMRGIGFGLMIVAGAEALLGVCMLTVAGAEVLIVAAWFLAIALTGLWMYRMGKHYEKTDKLHEALRTVIYVSHITGTQRMAEIMNLTRGQIENELARMIRWGVLHDVQLDTAQGKLLLPKEEWANKTVKCAECGAELVINVGETLVCPFCGTAL